MGLISACFSAGHCSGCYGKLLYYQARTSFNKNMFLSGESRADSFPSDAQVKTLTVRDSTGGTGRGNPTGTMDKIARWLFFVRPLLGLTVLLTIAGCKTAEPAFPDGVVKQAVADHSDAIILREGDVVKITFPGAPELNSTQPIRRDGNIVLVQIGELKAVGLTPAELQKELLKRGASAGLLSKEVTVTVESSSFPVYVTGAVVRPGKITPDHPINVLEAIMEAGGPDYTKANLKAVTVLRQEQGEIKSFIVNVQDILDGRKTAPFYLKPYDTIYVKEKFAWF
jgi:polysaccharide export outer membrane protein